MKENIYISLVELGINSEGLELDNNVYTKWKTESEYDERLCNEMLHQCYLTVRKNDGTSVFLLKGEYYFNYIDYLELKDARKNAKSARKWSLIAFAVSLVSIGISVFFGWQQLNKPIELSQATIDALNKPEGHKFPK